MLHDEEGPSVPTNLLSSSDYEPQDIVRSGILLEPMTSKFVPKDQKRQHLEVEHHKLT